MISKKDKLILKFIEEHKCITINQCAKTVFTGNKYAYDQARKQLQQLYKEKIIQRYKNINNEAVYYTTQKLGIHELEIIDVYSELIFLGAKVELFKKKYRINISEKKYREIDALIELSYDDFFIPLIIEIDYTHYTSITKLQEIYNSNHFQEKYKDIGENIFPLIVIVRPVVLEKEVLVKDGLLIFYTDFSLDDLQKILE